MAILRDIVTRFGFDVDQKKLKGLESNISRIKTGLIAAGAALIGGGIVKSITGVADQADNYAKLGKAMGLSAQALQEIEFAANLSGVTLEETTKSMLQLGKRARDASVGQKKQVEAFKELGVEVKNSQGGLKGQGQLLAEVADRFKAMPQGTKKSALAMEIFGKTGAKLIPLLNEGSAGINKMRKEARALGGVFSDKAAKQAEDFNDALLRTKTAFKGVRNRLALQLLPALTRLMKRFTDWIKIGDNSKRLMEGIKRAAKVTAVAIGLIITAKALNGFVQFGRNMAAGISVLIKLGSVAKATAIRVALIPLGILAIALAIEDLVGFAQGRDSVIGRLLGDSALGEEIKGILLDIGAAGIAIFRELAPVFSDVFKTAKPLVIAVFAAFKPFIPILGKIAAFLIKVFLKGILLLLKAIKFLMPAIRFLVRATMAWVGVLFKFWKAIFSALAFLWRNIVKGMVAAVKWLRPAWDAIALVIATIIGALKSVWGFMVKAMAIALIPLKAAWNFIAGIIKGIVRGIAKVWKVVLGGMISGVKALGKVFAKIGKGIAWVWNKALAAIRAVKSAVGKAKELSPFSKGHLKLTKARVSFRTPAIPPGLAAPAIPGAGRAQGGTTAVTKVGTVAVNIQGSTGMTSPEVSAAVKAGVKDAFKAEIEATFRDIKAPIG